MAAFVEDAFGPVDVPVDVPVVRVSDPVPVLKVLRVRDPVLRGSVAVLQFFSLPNCLILWENLLWGRSGSGGSGNLKRC
jgi:hypothetical protein